MEILTYLILYFLIFTALWIRYIDAIITADHHITSFNRTNFPTRFVFGAASSANQVINYIFLILNQH